MIERDFSHVFLKTSLAFFFIIGIHPNTYSLTILITLSSVSETMAQLYANKKMRNLSPLADINYSPNSVLVPSFFTQFADSFWDKLIWQHSDSSPILIYQISQYTSTKANNSSLFSCEERTKFHWIFTEQVFGYLVSDLIAFL